MDTKICRICLHRTTANISLFDKSEHNSLTYITKIMRCANVIIEKEDNLPSRICEVCVKKLNISYEFVITCEASDAILRNGSCGEIAPDLECGIKKEEIKSEFYDDHGYEDNFSNNIPPYVSIEEIEDKKNTKGKSFNKNKSHSYHRKSSPKLGSKQCVICGLVVGSPSAMDTHMRTHTGERPYPCPKCNSCFPTKGAVKRHVETYHAKRERKFTCETCGNSFFRKNDIITHIRIHTDERPYVCVFCSKTFRQIASLIRHKRTHTGEKPYGCPICDKRFSDKQLVNKHQTVHSDEKKFSCHLCGKSVKTKNALNTHISLHSKEKQIICNYCGLTISSKGNLKLHIQRAHSEKSGQCSICLKTFSDLEEHMRKHTGEKPFACSFCNQAFTTKRSLAYHMVFKHENASKFKCTIGDCSKTFPTTTMLKFHLLKQHTNHTPYVCQFCSRGFFRTSDLTRHLKVNHNDK